ncbi:glycosyltransferase family 4 protein [Brytella acorum]|uniref:UDP-phosphate alpha N-acetylglucosaminyltransferase n=1 Tax=Brytella acorum TaxID=2959299 RepID=A0AA35UJV5_9PROT|nr:UDP-phosphate alpha N-acetylglucosaminyltransferase [Brytella acorum]MDF3624340.1 UDP-phosphate alpha N-acetylglucosaminyltransferase [Brytella acorum]CAI9121697.1 UDP-phosphate alpha N-acetylglucosaminyltransferase [Brytella acorum]
MSWPRLSWSHLVWPTSVLIAIMTVCMGLVIVMIRVGVMDVPGHRSSHARPTPKGGGIGIMAGFLLGVPALYWAAGFSPASFAVTAPLTAIGLLALFSWLDDVHSFSAASKLGMQFGAALIVLVATQWPANTPHIWLYASIALFWLLYVTNAINFIDGVNGLASGSMALTALAAASGFMIVDRLDDALAPLALAACLLVFLPFNFPTARIFMGDVGSQGAGLATAWFGLRAFQHTATPLLMPLMLLPILYDVGFTLIRRALEGRRLTEAHRGHLYQLAVRAGASPVRVTLLYWFLALWNAIATLTIQTWPLLAVAIAVPLALWTLGVLRQASRTVSRPW